MLDAVSMFTPGLKTTLDELAERMMARIAPVTGPRVLIVPALPGSEIGRRSPAGDEIVWLDVEGVRQGRLLELAYGGPPLEPLGLFEPVYLQLILRLRLAGYDVGTHPYDWRRPVRELGRDLSERIRAEGREVHVVCHSFGGLVTRAAAVVGTPNLGKVIMLGTPNLGSFGVVQGIRGSHWVLHTLGTVDGRHSAAELAEGAFATWPSVYDALPWRTDPAELDLFDPGQWPAAGVRPDARLLASAAESQAWLATPTGQLYVIAGHGVPTVERVERRDGIFHYHRSDDGDGFVSTGRARIDGHPCYYVRASHAGMPNYQDVIGAVEDLLDHGATDRLSTVAPVPVPCPLLCDADVPEPPFQGRRGVDLDANDLRDVYDEVGGFMFPLPVF